MQLYFIRHAQSENNTLWDNAGSNSGRSDDPELTEIGRRQAETLAEFLRRADAATDQRDPHNITGFHFTHLYSSLMVRAVATGAYIANAVGLPLIAWLDLHETGGIYLADEQTHRRVGRPGKNRTYFETDYPELVLPDTLGEAGWWNRPYEGVWQRSIRARRVWRELMQRHGNTADRVAVIVHGGFYNQLLAALFHLPRHQPDRVRSWLRDVLIRLKLIHEHSYQFALNNAAITRIDFHDDVIRAVYFNRIDFLPSDLIT
ncbi:MAG: histidine phosphatase family protein [Anaerolineae bacterium]